MSTLCLLPNGVEKCLHLNWGWKWVQTRGHYWETDVENVSDRHYCAGADLPLSKGKWLPWSPKSQAPPKILFIYDMRIKQERLLLMVFITTTTVCVSELNVLLVYPACSKLKYASEADCRTSVRSLFPSARTPLSLSLSLRLLCLASGTAQLLSLFYV